MARVLKWLGGGLLAVLLVAFGIYAWATSASNRLLASTVESHSIDFPIPFPLAAEEVAALGLSDEEAAALALERAQERGRHLIASRYPCADCHGQDFGGGVMVDDPIMGRLLGPNLTSGAGGRTASYTAADWDRAVRHGILPDGRVSAMPAVDFQLMSDQELSDIVVHVEGLPPIDADVAPVTLGPLGRVLIAAGKIPLSAHLIPSHDAEHTPLPPVAEASVEFGRHLGGVCTGCHGQDLAGGPIPGGDPSWAAARNLTPHENGLADWSYEEFVTAMRAGTRPDGTPLLVPMTMIRPYAEQMTDTEMEALWLFLRSVPAVDR